MFFFGTSATAGLTLSDVFALYPFPEAGFFSRLILAATLPMRKITVRLNW